MQTERIAYLDVAKFFGILPFVRLLVPFATALSMIWGCFPPAFACRSVALCSGWKNQRCISAETSIS